VKEKKVMRRISGGKGTPLAFLASLLLLGIIVTLVGCGGGSALVGKWELEDGPRGSVKTIEFFSGGTGSMDGTAIEWKAERGRVMVSAFGQTQTESYKISGSMVTFRDDEGSESRYKKVKN
jgi:hypothetical protein